ncbi:hypothetical protein LOK49_LG12G00927 [Camellia lanceoleosa]|uniref:Uncharacterized protein n=1 Tax=Camellia lanceoleosa TaxID=1840588 RepID=A0ACC0FQ90_9ERIC|nr:hypothetical protein LOK49_LG12G00927 [Camellia lanceoleosa]
MLHGLMLSAGLLMEARESGCILGIGVLLECADLLDGHAQCFGLIFMQALTGCPLGCLSGIALMCLYCALLCSLCASILPCFASILVSLLCLEGSYNYGDGLEFFLGNSDLSEPIEGGAMGLPIKTGLIRSFDSFVAMEFDTYFDDSIDRQYPGTLRSFIAHFANKNACGNIYYSSSESSFFGFLYPWLYTFSNSGQF